MSHAGVSCKSHTSLMQESHAKASCKGHLQVSALEPKCDPFFINFRPDRIFCLSGQKKCTQWLTFDFAWPLGRPIIWRPQAVGSSGFNRLSNNRSASNSAAHYRAPVTATRRQPDRNEQAPLEETKSLEANWAQPKLGLLTPNFRPAACLSGAQFGRQPASQSSVQLDCKQSKSHASAPINHNCSHSLLAPSSSRQARAAKLTASQSHLLSSGRSV